MRGNKRIAWASALGLLAACAAQPQVRRPLGEDGKRQREILRWDVLRPVVRGQDVAVAAGTQLVTQAAMRTLQAGGNAVDAGVAALLAGGVTEFSHYGFGGEAPLLIRTADGEVHSIAGVGTAPKRMTLEFFLGLEPDPRLENEAEQRNHETGLIPSYGTLPALVPGMVDAALLALQEFGTLSFAEVAEPAAVLAAAHPLDLTRAISIPRSEEFPAPVPDVPGSLRACRRHAPPGIRFPAG